MLSFGRATIPFRRRSQPPHDHAGPAQISKSAFAKILLAAVLVMSAIIALNARATAQLHPPAQCCSPSQTPLYVCERLDRQSADVLRRLYATMPASEITALRAG